MAQSNTNTSATLNSQAQQNAMATVTLIDGYWFYFQDEGTDIAVHGSAWSGKETVYVNDNPVSDKRALLSCVSEHEFTHGAHDYKVRYEVTSLMCGALECSLFKDGTLLASQKKAYIEKNKNTWMKVLFLFFAGFGFGSAVASLVKYFAA